MSPSNFTNKIKIFGYLYKSTKMIRFDLNLISSEIFSPDWDKYLL